MADSVPVMGRKQLELEPNIARELRALIRRRDAAEAAIWETVDDALARGEPQAAIARVLGVSRQAIQQRTKARDPDA